MNNPVNDASALHSRCIQRRTDVLGAWGSVVRATLLCVILATLSGCGTVRAGLRAYRDISTAVADDLIAAVDGVAQADRDRER